MHKIKISAVSYLNTRPFIYGIRNSPVNELVSLTLDTPSACAAKILTGEADIGLVPVAVMHEIPSAEIISRFCIGASGAVGSVLLAGEVPYHAMERIFLDYQSKTSIALAKIIAGRLWKINPEFIPANPGYEKLIKGKTGGVIIGDRALRMKPDFPYVYDLALAWKELTQMPFVFACWISNKKTDAAFLNAFEAALEKGVASIDEMLVEEPAIAANYPDAENYLKNLVQYKLDDDKKKGMELFLSMLK